MDSIFEYKNRTVRVSYSLENPLCQEKQLLDYIEKENGYFIPAPYRLGIELKENHGGRVCYGFVSACIVPGKERRIGVVCKYGQELPEDIWSNSIYNSSTVGVGLPYEFRTDLEQYIISSLEMEDIFPWCNILYDSFMYDKVGSSMKIYSIIISMMLDIIKDNLQESIMDWSVTDFAGKFPRVY